MLTFLRPQEWLSVVKGQPLVDVLATIIGATFLLETFVTTRKFVWVPQNGFVLVLFGAVLLSHITHAYLQGLINSFAAFLPNVILYFLLLNTIQSVRQFKIAIAVIATLNVLLVFQGVYQIDHGYGWAGQAPVGFEKPGEPNRITWVGIFSDPNDLALSFVVATALTLAVLFGASSFPARVFSGCALGLLVYGVYLTNSRGGILALAAAALFYVGKRSGQLGLALASGLVLLPMVVLLGPSRAADLSAADASAQGRLDAWYHGLQLLEANPLSGAGYGMFTDDFTLTAHNSFILAAAELGLVGLFCWFGLIYVSYRSLSVVSAGSSDLGKYAVGLQSALIGFSVAAFFLSRTYTIMPFLLFALSGSSLAIDRKRGGPEYRLAGADLRNIAVWSAGLLAMAYASLKVGL